MSLKVEGANSEVTKKIKGAEAKLLAKGKAKMPNAKEFKVKMRPNLVKASSGTFYGGHLYGTEDGTKWMKCAEVRIREGKGEAAPKPVVPSKKEETKEDLKDEILHGIQVALRGLSYDFKDIKILELNKSRANPSVRVKISLTGKTKKSSASRDSAYGEWLNEKNSIKSILVHSFAVTKGGLHEWKVLLRNVELPKNPPSSARFRLKIELTLQK